MSNNHISTLNCLAMAPINAFRRQCLTRLASTYQFVYTRALSTSIPAARNADSSKTVAPQPHKIDPRWLTTTKRRLGKCMMFGLKPAQIHEAGEILQQIARDWRELIAGSEGYLTDATRRGLFRQSVAWGEMDTMGHVNNVNYVRYAETGRVYMTRNFAMHIDPAHKKEWLNIVGNTGIGIILRSIKIDYKFPMKYPDEVTVYHKIAHDPAATHSPKDAFYLQAVIISEARQRPAARVHEDLVIYDYKRAKKTEMPPFMLEQFKSTWELQEQAKKFWQQRILDIETRIRTLEVESWDREDAVEDTGSAKK
ncbi:thioesterase-like superfamily-domain-containing protein [Aspergillus bertholletiae]|uniref:Thioesterase-like superfamily-domain-containing protein n=1 Tax=Aspergillus bertholletiae TaxID=1226010 RepID=A0A5N7BNZ6_9EURO|nr:thioesterase-like superfamily-domain-containing protein [Aspergillus bertholletiae]